MKEPGAARRPPGQRHIGEGLSGGEGQRCQAAQRDGACVLNVPGDSSTNDEWQAPLGARSRGRPSGVVAIAARVVSSTPPPTSDKDGAGRGTRSTWGVHETRDGCSPSPALACTSATRRMASPVKRPTEAGVACGEYWCLIASPLRRCAIICARACDGDWHLAAHTGTPWHDWACCIGCAAVAPSLATGTGDAKRGCDGRAITRVIGGWTLHAGTGDCERGYAGEDFGGGTADWHGRFGDAISGVSGSSAAHRSDFNGTCILLLCPWGPADPSERRKYAWSTTRRTLAPPKIGVAMSQRPRVAGGSSSPLGLTVG
mmetsp:Transcript_132613/g.383373  ORF Transcript_132613/g.383373 Transcript_132613/m.383373 type:complete len:315 (-) Transcript_132613:538-1482(-)